MERTLSLKEINLNDKRTKWVAFSIMAHTALIFSPSLKKEAAIDKLILSVPKSKVQLQIRKKTKPTPVVRKKTTKKLEKVARKKVVKKIEPVKKEVAQTKPINNVVTKSETYNNLFKNYVEPIYPRILHRRRVTGHAVVTFTISKTGQMLELNVVETTHKLFKKSILRALSQWTFKDLPKKMKVRRKIVFNFKK